MRSYQIHFIIEKPVVLIIGKLGTFEFPAGRYVYTGSARKNIEARISRHLSKKKRRRWHIDYLLTTSHPKIIKVELFDRDECVVNQETEGKILVPRFGATDCRNNCGSHLKYVTEEDLPSADLATSPGNQSHVPLVLERPAERG